MTRGEWALTVIFATAAGAWGLWAASGDWNGLGYMALTILAWAWFHKAVQYRHVARELVSQRDVALMQKSSTRDLLAFVLDNRDGYTPGSEEPGVPSPPEGSAGGS